MICEIVEALEKQKITYTLGGCTLVGAADGNSKKHSPNPTLYLFSPSRIKIIRLFFSLLSRKIILKPKPGFFKLKRGSQRGFLFPLRRTPQGYTAVVKNESIHFSNKDLSPDYLKRVNENSVTYMVPRNPKEFVGTYENQLLSKYYQPPEVQLTDKSEHDAVNLLKGICSTIKKNGLEAWIEGGTLLGAIRDNKLIPWDHDIDMGIIFPGIKNLENLIKALKKRYRVRTRYFKSSQNKTWNLGVYRLLKIHPRKFFFFKHKICCDLFIYYPATDKKTGEKIYRYVVWDHNAIHKAKHFENLGTIDFYGSPITIPAYPEEFLTTKYGEDWRTPKKKWNVALNDGSIVSR